MMQDVENISFWSKVHAVNQIVWAFSTSNHMVEAENELIGKR